ncbi:MAG: MerR family transcriptional regulator [Pyrinomonadaceae bacterium]
MRQRTYIGVAELAGQVAKILAESGPAQERGTVSEVPDERTIRYYLSEGLLSPAEEKQGTASVFGYQHLLQLLVIKKLQAEHLPIRKIRELVQGRSEKELERLLGLEGGAAGKNAALSYLETLLMKPAAPPTASASYTRAATLPTPPPPPANCASAAQSKMSAPARSEAGTWERVEIEPGLELHIRGDYQPPQETKGLRRLTQLLSSAIELFGQRPRKRGSR